MPQSRVASDPKWVPVRATMLGRRPAAIRVQVDGEMIWMPRSCLEDGGSAADDALVSGVFMPVVDLSVIAWKAKEIGAI